MNKKLISKCCHYDYIEKKDGGQYCLNCGEDCELIEEPQPIQKEEIKTATEMMVKDMQEEEYYRIKHTSSDTFIEEIGKIFYEMEEDTTKIDFDLNQRNIKRRNEIMSLLKSSLQEQRQEIEKEYSEKLNKYRTGILDELEELGYNKDAIERNRQSILEEIEKMKVSEISASEGNNELRGRISENLNSRFTNGACIEWAMAELYNQALEDIKQLLKTN